MDNTNCWKPSPGVDQDASAGERERTPVTGGEKERDNEAVECRALAGAHMSEFGDRGHKIVSSAFDIEARGRIDVGNLQSALDEKSHRPERSCRDAGHQGTSECRQTGLETSSFRDPICFGFDAVVLTGVKLGGGSFGDVVEAMWLGTTVAVKRIPPKNVTDFLQETSILKTLRHPNIIQFLGVVGLRQWIIFERLEGRVNISSISRDLKSALDVSLDVGRAMAYAHNRGIINRDLKPSNILTDGRGCYKVGDWGLSRKIAADGRMSGDTGTYEFMAPEVIRCDRYDSKCDVYSFGIFLWSLVTGTAIPYPYFTPVQAASGVVKKDLRPTIPRGVPKSYKQLMTACWLPRPQDRPDFIAIVTKLTAIRAEIQLQAEREGAKSSSGWFR